MNLYKDIISLRKNNDDAERGYRFEGSLTLLIVVCLCSCSTKMPENAYSVAYNPVSRKLPKVNEVAVYTFHLSEKQKFAGQLQKAVSQKVHPDGSITVGTATLTGFYNLAEVKSLAATKGANTVLVFFSPAGTQLVSIFKAQSQPQRFLVSYYGTPYPSPYYYPYGQIIQPYQVAPPTGDLLGGMTDFMEARNRLNEEYRRSEQVRPKRKVPIYYQELYFVRLPQKKS